MTEERLVVLVNSGVTMSRGKYAAQAIHAALNALGTHPGCSVVVLGGTSAEVEACPVHIRDAGLTELEPGTLTAGVRELPTALAFAHPAVIRQLAIERDGAREQRDALLAAAQAVIDAHGYVSNSVGVSLKAAVEAVTHPGGET